MSSCCVVCSGNLCQAIQVTKVRQRFVSAGPGFSAKPSQVPQPVNGLTCFLTCLPIRCEISVGWGRPGLLRVPQVSQGEGWEHAWSTALRIPSLQESSTPLHASEHLCWFLGTGVVRPHFCPVPVIEGGTVQLTVWRLLELLLNFQKFCTLLVNAAILKNQLCQLRMESILSKARNKYSKLPPTHTLTPSTF